MHLVVSICQSVRLFVCQSKVEEWYFRGCPEMSTFFTYEISSHKGGEGVAKMETHLITFFNHKSTTDTK